MRLMRTCSQPSAGNYKQPLIRHITSDKRVSTFLVHPSTDVADSDLTLLLQSPMCSRCRVACTGKLVFLRLHCSIASMRPDLGSALQSTHGGCTCHITHYYQDKISMNEQD
jgi:hypothetical protein